MNIEKTLQILESLVEATSGAIAGACSTTILYPFDVLLVRYQTASCSGIPRSDSTVFTPRAPTPGVLDIITRTLEERGGILKAMYGGMEVKLVEVLIRNFVYFYW